MGLSEFINEQLYILFSMYYYEVFLYNNKIQVGRLIQLVSFNPVFIVDFKRKLAWPICEDTGFVKGHKIILHYKLNNALPLTESKETIIKEINNNVVKVKKVIKLSAKVTKEQKTKAGAMVITESNLPPFMIFEMFNAYFVTFTLSKPKNTDWTLIIGALIIAIIIIAFMVTTVFGLK